MSSSLGRKTINGLKWSYLATIISALIQVVYTMVINRLLSPVDFGLVAMANVVLRFGSYFAQMGLGTAIVQKKDLSATDIRATFTLALLFSVVIYSLIYFLAPYLIHLFDEPNPSLVPIIQLLGVTFIINGVTAISQNLLRKHMKFKTLSVTEVSTYFIGYVLVGITLALMGYGVWSVVYAAIVQSGLNLIALYAQVKHSLKPIFGFRYFRPILSYGSQVSLISFMEFLKTNLDTLLIGKTLGFYNLGLYNRALIAIRLPLVQINTSLSRVIFPAFSTIQSDLKKLSGLYLQSTMLLASLILSLTGFCFGAATEIILILLGEKYLSVVPVFRVLTLGIGFNYIAALGGIVCDATAYLKPKSIFTILHLSAVAGLIYLFKSYGLVGIAWAMTISYWLKMVGFAILLKPLLPFTFKALGRQLIPGSMNATILGGLGFGLSNLLHQQEIPLILRFALCCLAALLIFIFIIRLPYNKPLRDFISDKILPTYESKIRAGGAVAQVLAFMKFDYQHATLQQNGNNN